MLMLAITCGPVASWQRHTINECNNATVLEQPNAGEIKQSEKVNSDVHKASMQATKRNELNAANVQQTIVMPRDPTMKTLSSLIKTPNRICNVYGWH